MCYAKPGPRCSPHAKSALEQAEKTFLNVVKADERKAFSAYSKLQEAQRDYDLTPAGQADIQALILAASNPVEKYELEQRLKKAVTQRKTALRAVKSKDLGDIPHTASKNRTLPPALLPDATVKNSGNTFSPEALKGALYGTGLPYEYTTDYDEATNFSSITLHGFTREITADDWFAAAYNLKGDAPQSFYDEFEGVRFEDHLTPEVYNDYYGQGLGGFKVSDELQRKTERVFYSQPDADDRLKGFEYARQEGVDTSGLTPYEAVRATAKYGDSAHSKLINNTSSLGAEVLNLKSIKFSTVTPATSTPYDYRRLRNEAIPSVSAGVVVKDDAGEYHLVGGAERFKAAQETKRNTWLFHILY